MAQFDLAVWAHNISNFGATPDEMRSHLDRLADAGIDLLIPCVKNRPGTTDFRSNVADVNESYPEWDPLRLLIDESSERGMDVHAWLIDFSEESTSRFRRNNPDTVSTISDPHGHQWLCACRQDVQDNIFAIYEDLATSYRPAGLHLDYVRTGGWCTCDHCAAEMAKVDIDIRSIEVESPEGVVWAKWKADRLTGFVARMHELTIREGIELSAAVIGDYPHHMNEQGQDWVRWIDEGIVDAVFPMNYNHSNRIVELNATAHVAHAAGRVPVWEGLFRAAGKDVVSTEQMGEQIRSCLERGADGISIFHYPALNDEDMVLLKRLKSE